MEERIKDLKNKNIKIKRVKKPEMSESVYIKKDQEEEKRFSYSQVERIPSIAIQSSVVQAPAFLASPLKQHLNKKQENAMFYSTAQNLQGRGQDMGEQVRKNIQDFQGGANRMNLMKESIMSTFAAVNMKESNYNQYNKTKILVEDPRAKNKRENPLFYSTNQQVNPVSEFIRVKKEDPLIQEYGLGKTVNSVLKKEESRLKEISSKIEEEKKKVDQDLDDMVQTMIRMFDQTRSELHAQMDDYLAQYVKNYENLKNRVKQFRSFDSENSEYSNMTSIGVTINKIEYFGKDPSNYEQLNKYKEEKCRISCRADKLEREVEKRLLTYLSNELEKMARHPPAYNHSGSSNELLVELKEGLCEQATDRLVSFQHLLFVSPYTDLATYVAQAGIDHLVSNDGNSAIATQADYHLDTDTQVDVQALGGGGGEGGECSNVMPIGEDLLAVGHYDGCIKVFSRKEPEREPQRMTGHHQGGINSLCVMRLNACTIQGETALSDQLTMGGQQNSSQEYLVSGGMTDRRVVIWDLQNWTAIKIFQGHSGGISSLLPMRDRQHLASASTDGSWCLWDVTAQEQPRVCRYTDNNGFSVNVLLLSKNKHFLFSASHDQTIKVYTNDYQFSIKAQRQVLTDSLLAFTLQDDTQVTALSISSICDNTLFSGGQDALIKQWSVKNKQIIRVISGHTECIRQMVLFEDPLKKVDSRDGDGDGDRDRDKDKENSFIIISIGEGEKELRLSTGEKSINRGIELKQDMCIKKNQMSNPMMALVQNSEKGQMELLVLNQSIESHYLRVTLK